MTNETTTHECPVCGNVHLPRDGESQADLHCHCGDFVSDPSGEAGCGNCGADYPPA